MSDAIMERLEERRDAGVAPPDEGQQEGWKIRTQDEAAWASRKARDAHREVNAINEWEQREIERVRAAADAERKRPQGTAEFMEAALGEYVLELARDGRDKKSLTLPGGRIQLRARGPQMTTDEGKLLAWLKENGHSGFVKVKESVDNAGLKKHLQRVEGGVALRSTGEFVEGVDLAEQPDSVSFSPDLEGRGDG